MSRKKKAISRHRVLQEGTRLSGPYMCGSDASADRPCG